MAVPLIAELLTQKALEVLIPNTPNKIMSKNTIKKKFMNINLKVKLPTTRNKEENTNRTDRINTK